jgi:hypothetical protein
MRRDRPAMKDGAREERKGAARRKTGTAMRGESRAGLRARRWGARGSATPVILGKGARLGASVLHTCFGTDCSSNRCARQENSHFGKSAKDKVTTCPQGQEI